MLSTLWERILQSLQNFLEQPKYLEGVYLNNLLPSLSTFEIQGSLVYTWVYIYFLSNGSC